MRREGGRHSYESVAMPDEFASVVKAMGTPTLQQAKASFLSLSTRLQQEARGVQTPMSYSRRGMQASAHFFDKQRAAVLVSRNYTGERARSFWDVVSNERMWHKVLSSSAK